MIQVINLTPPAAISWGIGSLYSHKADLPNNILISTGMMLFVGGLFLLGIGMIIGEFNMLDVSKFSSSSILSLMYLIIVGTTGWLGFLDFEKYYCHLG